LVQSDALCGEGYEETTYKESSHFSFSPNIYLKTDCRGCLFFLSRAEQSSVALLGLSGALTKKLRRLPVRASAPTECGKERQSIDSSPAARLTPRTRTIG
jgi:hypothetical protein